MEDGTLRAEILAALQAAGETLRAGTPSPESLEALASGFRRLAGQARESAGRQAAENLSAAAGLPQQADLPRQTGAFCLREESALSVPGNPDGPENLLIEGDNLPVLRLLQKTYAGKIDVMYIDPPYNTGKNGFVYGDRFRAGTDRHGPWLAFMEQRLKAAKPLLSERGVLFISIDDNEQARLKILCDGIFGEENCAGTMIHQRAKGGGQAKHLVRGHDYILVYAADLSRADLSRRKVVQKKTVLVNGERCVKNDDFLRKSFGKYGKDSDRRCFYEEIETYKGAAKKREVDAKLAAGKYFLEQAEQDGGLHRVCRYENLSQSRSKLYSIVKILSEEGKKDLEALGITGFEYPKPVELVKFLVDAASKKDSLVLDFFAGSGTTGQAVMRLNREDGGRRRFILCTSGENGICRNITRKRLARAAQAEGGGTGTTRFFTLEPAQS